MLSKVTYTAPELENDTQVIVELAVEKNGFESDPIEVTLEAKGFEVPSAPVIGGASEVQENQTLTLNYTIDAKATLKGQADKGTLTIGETIEFVAPEVDNDTEATLSFYAQRGSKVSETITKTITIRNVMVKSDALIVKGTPEGKVNEQIVVEFTNAVGTLEIKGTQSGFTATVEGKTVKVTSANANTYTFKVTQTEDGKLESDETEVSVIVKELEKSATLTTSATNTEIEVDSTADIEFDNVVGTLKVSEISEGIEAKVSGSKVEVTAKTEGSNSFKVTQTEDGKLESDALTVNITCKAKSQVVEKSETLTIDSADISVSLTNDTEGKVISFNNATGTLNLAVTSGDEFGTASVEDKTIKVVPTSAGAMELSVTQTQDSKTESDPLVLNITIEEGE